MSPTDPPTDMGAVARDVDRVSRRVDDHARDLVEIGEQVAGIDRNVGDLGETLARLLEVASLRPQSWLLLDDPETAQKLLPDLVGWLDAVYLRYPGSELPACWLWHPWVVEELWWLRCSHAESYAGRGWGVRAGMWHDQQRPRVVERIRTHLGSCDLEQHKAGRKQARPPAAAPLAGHVQAIAEAWTSTGLTPEPTAEQIEDARKYDEAQLRLT